MKGKKHLKMASAHFLPSFCPVFKTKVGSKKPRKIKGFSHFCPVSQFFLLFNTIKNFNKIKEITKKTGQSGQSLFFDTKEDEFYWTKDGARAVLLD